MRATTFLPEMELARHIAWDIGAAGITENLSALLDAPAIFCNTSRLVIDSNRQLNSPALIPTTSDGTPVPGNGALNAAQKTARIERWFTPYLNGQSRPWQIALASDTERRLADPLLAGRAPNDLVVGDNEPYSIETDIDYSIPVHAMRRGLLHVQVEFRQDEIADLASQRRWALRFAESLTQCT